MRTYLNKLSARKPVVFTGDLNVGHLDADIHNPGAKHIAKQAGLTERERSSHSELLKTNFQDAFRYFYPGACRAVCYLLVMTLLMAFTLIILCLDARGQFTYWSQRTFARPVNKGIRLDYFVCSRDMFAPRAEEAAEEALTRTASSSSVGSTAAALADTSLLPAVLAHRRDVSVEDTPSPGVYDSYSLPEDTKGCSDHAPVVLVLKV